MEKRLKSCTTTAIQDACNDDSDSNNGLLFDRLSTLPDELLIQILSLLPTKDGAATCFLSKRLRLLLPLLTNLDLDTSFTSHCSKLPFTLTSHCLEFSNKICEFYSFVTFVDTLLQAHRPQYLTRFRLGVGSNLRFHKCNECCLPDVANIDSWISFPLTRCGLKELDVRIHVKEPVQLPLDIFTCETLEVLKLDVNLLVDRVSTMTSFRLPNLKVLNLDASHLYEDGGSFLARLVSSCPLLEDLTLRASIRGHVQSIIISSPSLRILHIQIGTLDVDVVDFLLINTPNLEYLKFAANLALQQSITNMDRLIEADFTVNDDLMDGPGEGSFQQMLSFIRSLTNVHHLSLMETCIEDLNFDVIKDQLPIFRNLKYLALGNNGYACWDKVLVTFLKCSPVLETLVFPQGMLDRGDINSKNLQLEQEWCKTGLEIIPWCCKYHLKRIVIKYCCGNKREIDLIQFLLKYALVLEELVVHRFEDTCPGHRVLHKMEIQKTLQGLPRASVSCSIQVQGSH